MTDFMDQRTVCHALAAHRDHLLGAVAADASQQIHHNPLGEDPMSLTDLVIHVSMWDEIVLGILNEALAGRAHWSVDSRWETPECGRALNVGGEEAGRLLPASLVHERYSTARNALMEAIAAVNADTWHSELPFQHTGREPQTVAGLLYRVNVPDRSAGWTRVCDGERATVEGTRVGYWHRPPHQVRRAPPGRRRTTRVWHRDRVVLIGDAAHATSPAAGQGAAIACEDAVVLAQCLRDVNGVPDAFDTFERLRRERVEKVVAYARRRGSNKTASNAVSRTVRDLMLPIVFRLTASEKAHAWLYGHHLDWDTDVSGSLHARGT